MAYTLAGLRTRVQKRVRDTGYDSSEITDYLNDTQRDICNELRLPFMQTSQNYTLAINVSDITNGSNLPSNYVQAMDLVNTYTGYEGVIPYKSTQELDRYYPDEDDATRNPANAPTYWYNYAKTIRVFPQPDKAYTVTLRYYKSPTALSSDSDVPELPSEFEELLVLGAAYRVLQVKDNYDQAAILQNKYDEILQKLAVKYSQPQVGKPMRMRSATRYVGRPHF